MIFDKNIKELPEGEWVKLGNQSPYTKHYHLYSKSYPLRMLVDRKSGLIVLVTDTEKNKVVFNPLRNIDEGKNYEMVF